MREPVTVTSSTAGSCAAAAPASPADNAQLTAIETPLRRKDDVFVATFLPLWWFRASPIASDHPRLPNARKTSQKNIAAKRRIA
jgi:hypothetical protein